MSNSALKSLTIECLRGSVSPFTLPFEKGKKLTVIYGENGTGKSTICDAFDFIGNGKVGSLDDRGLGQTKKYWHAVGKKPAATTVKLETADGSCIASFNNSNVVTTPASHQPVVKVLRRSQILTNPAKTYPTSSYYILHMRLMEKPLD